MPERLSEEMIGKMIRDDLKDDPDDLKRKQKYNFSYKENIADKSCVCRNGGRRK